MVSSKESQVSVDFSKEFEYVGDAGAYHWMRLIEDLVETFFFEWEGVLVSLREVQNSMERRVIGMYADSVITMTWLKS